MKCSLSTFQSFRLEGVDYNFFTIVFMTAIIVL